MNGDAILPAAKLLATARTSSDTGVDKIIITLDLIYAGVFLLFGVGKVAYRFYFLVLRSGFTRRHNVLGYWLALLAFIVACMGVWVPVAAYWVFRDTKRYLERHLPYRVLRICLFLPAYIFMAFFGWMVIGAYSLVQKGRVTWRRRRRL